MSAHKGSIPWNKGTGKGWVDKRGYRWVYVTEYGKRRAKRESRVIMEKHLERILEPWELVHHKDGKPDNNSIDNLEVLEWDDFEHSKDFRDSTAAREYFEHITALLDKLNVEYVLGYPWYSPDEEIEHTVDNWFEQYTSDDPCQNSQIYSLKFRLKAVLSKQLGIQKMLAEYVAPVPTFDADEVRRLITELINASFFAGEWHEKHNAGSVSYKRWMVKSVNCYEAEHTLLTALNLDGEQ